MRNLDNLIREWRREMFLAGIKNFATLDELEAHVRRDVERLRSSLASEEEAFQSAVANLGSVESLRQEFGKLKRAERVPIYIVYAAWCVLSIVVVIYSSRLLKEGWTRPDLLILYAHTISLTASYLAAFAAGGLGIYCVALRAVRKLSTNGEHSLARATTSLTYVAAALVGIGWFLGMLLVVLRSHPTIHTRTVYELGASFMLFWLAVTLFAQHFYDARPRLTIFVRILTSLVVTLVWFGAPTINTWRAFSVTGYWPLEAAIGIHLIALIKCAWRENFSHEDNCKV